MQGDATNNYWYKYFGFQVSFLKGSSPERPPRHIKAMLMDAYFEMEGIENGWHSGYVIVIVTDWRMELEGGCNCMLCHQVVCNQGLGLRQRGGRAYRGHNSWNLASGSRQ